jgi:hypothetical protein
MNPYSVARVGNEYVVKVDGRSVLRVGSLRLAAKLISVAEQKTETDHRAAHDTGPASEHCVREAIRRSA